MDEKAFCYAGEYSGASPVAFHSHPAAELVFQAEGTCVPGLEDGREFVAAPGAVFAVPAGVAHRQASLCEARTVYVVGDTPFPTPRLFPVAGEPFVAGCFNAILDACGPPCRDGWPKSPPAPPKKGEAPTSTLRCGGREIS